MHQGTVLVILFFSDGFLILRTITFPQHQNQSLNMIKIYRNDFEISWNNYWFQLLVLHTFGEY